MVKVKQRENVGVSLKECSLCEELNFNKVTSSEQYTLLPKENRPVPDYGSSPSSFPASWSASMYQQNGYKYS